MHLAQTVSRAGLLALILASLPVSAQDANGPEFAVNAYTTGNQNLPDVAQDRSGHFVVTWSGAGEGDDQGIFARRFTSAGVPWGPEFRVNVATTGFQQAPVIASSAAGDFVVAWMRGPGGSYDFFARRFDAAGSPLGGELPVNADPTSSRRWLRIAGDAAGDFVVVWEAFNSDLDRRGVFGSRFDIATGFGPEFKVDSYTTGFHNTPAVGMAPDGSFVVSWVFSLPSSGSPAAIFARRFDASGAPLTDDVPVSDFTTGRRAPTGVAAASDGSFVVVWDDQLADGSSDADGDGILARRLDATGTPLTGPFHVNTYSVGTQTSPRVAVDPAGTFLVAWENYAFVDGNSLGVSARLFDDTGTPRGPEFVVDTYGTSIQNWPLVSAGPAGQFVVTWESYGEDGEAFGIFGQRYGDLIFGDSFESGGLSAWSAAATDGGDLSVTPAAALGSPGLGLRATVNDTTGVYVQDDTPNTENRYRARFYLDPSGFDPGTAQGHLRTRVFIAFGANPTRRLVTIVLKEQAGQYSLMGRVRRDDDGHDDTGFFPISSGPHCVELDWRRSSGPDALDGSFEMWIDGASVSTLGGLDDSLGAVDFARMGAMSVKAGASGTLLFDAFESRRSTPIGPLS